MSDDPNHNPPGGPPGYAPDPNAPPAPTNPQEMVRYGSQSQMAPHETVALTPQGEVPHGVLVRRGSSKRAIAASIALVLIGLELTVMAPGVGLVYAVIVLPIIIYMLRITRRPIENESELRRALATTGTTVITVLSAITFTFLSLVTIVYIICSGTHL